MCLYLNLRPKVSERLPTQNSTFLSPETDRELAEIELTTSNLYQNLIISEDAKTTAMLEYQAEHSAESLIDQRDVLRAKRLDSNLSATELDELSQLTSEVKKLRKDERNETALMVADAGKSWINTNHLQKYFLVERQ